MRFSQALLCSLCAVVAHAQDAKTTVSLRVHARPVVELSSVLTEKLGEPVKVLANIGNQILVADVTDVTHAELKARLAQATFGKWLKEGDTWYLTADTQARLAAANATLTKRAADLQKKLASLGGSFMGGMAMGGMSSVAIMTTADDPEKKKDTPRGVNEVVRDIAKTLNVRDLAALGDDERMVFSTNPNRAQRSLSPQALSLLREYIVANNTMVDQKTDAPEPNVAINGDEENAFSKMIKEQMERRKPRKITDVGKVLVIFTYEKMIFMPSGNGSITIKVLDSQGQAVSSQNYSAGFDFSFMQPPTPDDKPQPKEDALKFSKLSEEYQALSSISMRVERNLEKATSKELMECLMHPDKVDPSSFVHDEALPQVIAGKNLDLLAVIPDSVGNAFAFGESSSEMTPTAYLKTLTDGNLTITKEANWWVIRPTDLGEAVTIDRSALAKFIEVNQKSLVPGLDALADFASEAKHFSATNLFLKYGKVAQMLMSMQSVPTTSMDGLEFFGTLAPQERDRLRHGGSLAYGTLSPASRAVADRLIMGTKAAYRTKAEWAAQRSKSFMERAMTMFGGSDGWLAEPTEVCPSGPFAAIGISMPGDSDYAVIPLKDGKPALEFGALDSEMVGLIMGVAEQMKDQPEVANYMPDMNSVLLAKQTKYQLRFEARPGITAEYAMVDTSTDPAAKPVSLHDIPQAFFERANKAKEGAKGMFPMGMFRETPRP